jgi:hypothetical protein
MRPIKATFNTRCPFCDEPIYEGDDIVRVESEDAWLHADCAEEFGEKVDR